jgi:hypothetical protein
MGLIANFFKKPAPAATDQRNSRLDLMTGSQTRKEILAMAVRDALKKHGIPAGTVTSDALASNAAGRPDGVHLLLFFRDWNPALLPYLVSLEHTMLSRLSRLDPMSRTWLAGVSWRFEPREPSRWPKLPAVGQLTASKVASQPVQQNTRKDIEALLEQGDGSRPVADFSPTLPMQHATHSAA